MIIHTTLNLRKLSVPAVNALLDCKDYASSVLPDGTEGISSWNHTYGGRVTNAVNILSQRSFHSLSVGRQCSFSGNPCCLGGGLTQFIQALKSLVDKRWVDVAVYSGNCFADGEVGLY